MSEAQEQEIRRLRIRIRGLERLAERDPLTGILNRRGFARAASVALKRHRRAQNLLTDTPLSVVVIDLDKFKTLNDTFGHAAGDEVLRRFGSLLDLHLRETDLAARWGGDEFVLLIDDDHEAALRLAVRVIAILERELFRIAHDEHFKVQASAGVAEVQPGDRKLPTTIARADANLYHVKQGLPL